MSNGAAAVGDASKKYNIKSGHPWPRKKREVPLLTPPPLPDSQIKQRGTRRKMIQSCSTRLNKNSKQNEPPRDKC